jgi:hypothetical protein
MGGNKYDEKVKPSEVPATSSEPTQQTNESAPTQPEAPKADEAVEQSAA